MAIEKATSVVAAATAASRGGTASPESGLSSTATPWMGGVLNVSTSGRRGWDTQGVRAQGKPNTAHAVWRVHGGGIRHGWSMRDLLLNPIEEVAIPASSSDGNRVAVKLKGFGIPEQGFFSLKVDIPDMEKVAQFRGILTVEKGNGSVQKVATEMSHLFKEKKWDWNVKQISSNDFLIDFSSEDERRQVTKFGGFVFKTSSIKASVIDSKMTDSAVDELFVVWVKVIGLPSFAKKHDIVRAISDIVGEFKEIDEESLKGEGAVRVKEAEVDHDGTGSVEGGDEDDDNADDLDDDYPPGMGGKKDGKEKKDSPKKESPKGTDSKGKGGGKVQSAPPALRRATETMQKAFTLPVSIEPAEKDVGNTVIEVGKEGEDKAVVLWKSEDFSQPDIFDQMSQEDDKSNDLLKRMDVDLKLGGVKLFTDEEEEKCAIPTDSDIEMMRAEEDEDNEKFVLDSGMGEQNKGEIF
ncbi:hypothetical protein OsJ_36340 [Oryza sativa Japonica Group]|uniref:Uncharacterized protein n=1 Tax=Oryza sativa subsp. japonica TaxID=39947 RepID=B9GDH5_ORYSJ|nr:hypothetical protein OsJ_36340 [Oryza sativa Japonica Group]